MENKPCPLTEAIKTISAASMCLYLKSDFEAASLVLKAAESSIALRKEVEELRQTFNNIRAYAEGRDEHIENCHREIAHLKHQLRATELVWSKEVPTVFPIWCFVLAKGLRSIERMNHVQCAKDWKTCAPDCLFCPIPEPKESTQ